MRPPSTFTSSRHPAAVGVFIAAGLAGMWGLFIPGGRSNVVDLATPGFAATYYAGLALSGVAGLAALAFRDHDDRTRAERCAWYGVGYSGLFYALAALLAVGPAAGQAAFSAGIWSLIATWRILQITSERRKSRNDRAAGLPADPTPLGRDKGHDKTGGCP